MRSLNTENNIVIFKTDDNQITVDVRFYDESVWLTLDQMAALFERDKSTISRHIKNIYTEGELMQVTTVAKFATVQIEGDREVERNLDYYNLDVIISVGYRVKSLRGTQFRQWATKRLNEYIRKGFTMDDERLKSLGGGGYFKELLERIRDMQKYLLSSSKKYRIRYIMLFMGRLRQRLSIIELIAKKSLWGLPRLRVADLI